jgi:hypothetical protein
VLSPDDEVVDVTPQETQVAEVSPQQAAALNALTGVVQPVEGNQYVYPKPTTVSVSTPPQPNTSPTLGADKPRVAVLKEAASLITGDREAEYGTPQVNFQRIADLWNVQLAHLLKDDVKIQPTDVALAMLQVKLGRAVQSPKRDTFVDIAGYAGLAFELSETDDE